jgi:O-antigen/teichoic acid export membrane protein
MSGASELGVGGTRRPRFLSSAVTTFGAKVAVSLIALGNTLVIARALGPEGRGEVALLFAIGYLTGILATFGVQETNVNLAGAEPALRRSLATNSVILSTILGLASAVTVTVLVAAMPSIAGGVSISLILIALASVPAVILFTYLQFLIRGDYGFGVTNIAWIIQPLVNLVANGVLAAMGVLTVTSAIVAGTGGQFLATGTLVWYVRRRSVGFGRPSVPLARRMLTFGIKSHAGRIMEEGNYRFDQWILGAIAGTRELGLYSVAVAWAEGLFMLPTALSVVQRPDLVRSSASAAVREASILFRTAVILTAISAGALVVAAPLLCVAVFGEEFRGSIDDLRILTLGAFGMVALKQLGNALTARQQPTLTSLAIGAAFLSTVLLDLLLIPEHGGTGAAVASAVSYTFGGAVVALLFAHALGGKVRDLVPRLGDVRWTWAKVKEMRPGRLRADQREAMFSTERTS